MKLSQTLGKWNLKAGLRYEHNVSNYYVGCVRQEAQCRTYNDFHPSLSASTTLGDLQVSLNYAAKTKRPFYASLSDNIIYESRFMYTSGNSMLKPSTTQDISLMLVWKSFFLLADYTYVRNDMQKYMESYNGDEKIILSTMANYHHRNKFMADLGWNTAIGVWNPSYDVAFLTQWFSTTSDGITKNYNKPVVQLNCNNAFSLKRGWLINIDYFLQTKGNYGLYQGDWATNRLNFSVSKEMLDGKLRLQLSAYDILAKERYYSTINIGRYHISTQDNPHLRSISFTVRYSFNQTNSKYKGTGAGSSEKGRL